MSAISVAWFVQGVIFGAILMLVGQAYVAMRFIAPLFEPGPPKLQGKNKDVDFLARARARVAVRKRQRAIQAAVDAQAARGVANVGERALQYATSFAEDDAEEWPPEIVAYLKAALRGPAREATAEPAETDPRFKVHEIGWMNVVLQRMFVEWRRSDPLKTKLKAKLKQQLNKTTEKTGFIQDLHVHDIDFGSTCPLLHTVRILPHTSDALDVILEFDFEYQGGGSVSILTTLSIGFAIPLTVWLQPLRGKVRLRVTSPLNSEEFAVGFPEDPGFAFIVESALWHGEKEMYRDLLNKLIQKKLRSIFLELWILPNWRAFDLPLLTAASPGKADGADSAAENSDEKPHSGVEDGKSSAKAAVPSAGNGAASAPSGDQGGEAKEPHAEGKNTLNAFVTDLFAYGTVFPTTAMVSAARVGDYAAQLSAQFLALARERDSQAEGNGSSSGGSPNASASARDEWSMGPFTWKAIKNKRDVLVEKKRVGLGRNGASGETEVVRAKLKIACDVQRVVQVLGNPEHHRHVEDTFVASRLVERFDETKCVRVLQFKAPSGVRDITLLEVAKSSIESPQGASLEDSWFVVMRSVKGVSQAAAASVDPLATATDTSAESTSAPQLPGSKPQTPVRSATAPQTPVIAGLCNIYGYLVEPTGDGCTNVTVLSQFGTHLQRLDVSWARCSRLKLFIEELSQLSFANGQFPKLLSAAASGSGASGDGGESHTGGYFGGSGSSGNGGHHDGGSSAPKMERLRSALWATAGGLVKGAVEVGKRLATKDEDGAGEPHGASASSRTRSISAATTSLLKAGIHRRSSPSRKSARSEVLSAADAEPPSEPPSEPGELGSHMAGGGDSLGQLDAAAATESDADADEESMLLGEIAATMAAVPKLLAKEHAPQRWEPAEAVPPALADMCIEQLSRGDNTTITRCKVNVGCGIETVKGILHDPSRFNYLFHGLLSASHNRRLERAYADIEHVRLLVGQGDGSAPLETLAWKAGKYVERDQRYLLLVKTVPGPPATNSGASPLAESLASIDAAVAAKIALLLWEVHRVGPDECTLKCLVHLQTPLSVKAARDFQLQLLARVRDLKAVALPAPVRELPLLNQIASAAPHNCRLSFPLSRLETVAKAPASEDPSSSTNEALRLVRLQWVLRSRPTADLVAEATVRVQPAGTDLFPPLAVVLGANNYMDVELPMRLATLRATATGERELVAVEAHVVRGKTETMVQTAAFCGGNGEAGAGQAVELAFVMEPKSQLALPLYRTCAAGQATLRWSFRAEGGHISYGIDFTPMAAPDAAASPVEPLPDAASLPLSPPPPLPHRLGGAFLSHSSLPQVSINTDNVEIALSGPASAGSRLTRTRTSSDAMSKASAEEPLAVVASDITEEAGPAPIPLPTFPAEGTQHLLPLSQVEASQSPHEWTSGSLAVENQRGLFALRFDNTDSLLTAKRIFVSYKLK